MTPYYKKELDSLTISLLTRQHPLEIITHNISKALLHFSDTLLDELLRASVSRKVLPVVTSYSTLLCLYKEYEVKIEIVQ